jgi:glycosyltransferase
LPDCLNSVARQTYTHLEHAVVDGASTDGTVDIINQLIKQHANQITAFITEPDKGIYDALNKGLKRSNKQMWWGFCMQTICMQMMKCFQKLRKLLKTLKSALFTQALST